MMRDVMVLENKLTMGIQNEVFMVQDYTVDVWDT